MPGNVGRTHEKIAITLPTDLARAARAEAKVRQSHSLSAFIAQAVEEKLEKDNLQRILDDIFAENPMTDEERSWADELLTGR